MDDNPLLHRTKKKMLNVAGSWLKNNVNFLTPNKSVPLWAHLWVTRRCNLRCKYCYVYDDHYPELSTNDMKRAIRHIKNELECNLIAIMGGEPLVRRDIVELVAYMSAENIFSFMTTNGLLLKDKMIYNLMEADLNFLEISLDSMGENNVSKKTGVKLMPIIERVDEFSKIYNTEISINMVLTKQNYRDVDHVIRFLAGKNISLTIGLYIPDPTDPEGLMSDPLAFTSKADLALLREIEKHILRLKRMGAFIAMDSSYFRQWESFMRQLVQNSVSSKPIKPLWRCKPGLDFIEIDADGRIRYCSYLNSHVSPKLTIFDLKKDYYREMKHRFEETVDQCNGKCLANCFYQVANIKKHPLRFARQVGFRHFQHYWDRKFDPSVNLSRYERRNQFVAQLGPPKVVEILRSMPSEELGSAGIENESLVIRPSKRTESMDEKNQRL